MPIARVRRLFRRTRTAISLPGRVVECEDRNRAIEAHVATKLDEMRSELAEIRLLLRDTLEADADATELLGRLLQSASGRLDALEATLTGDAQLPGRGAQSTERV